MRVGVEFAGESAVFELPDGRLIGSWGGPGALDRAAVRRCLRDALENPRDYPPLRQAVVPGDRVVIPLNGEIPDLTEILGALCDVLLGAGVEPGDIAVLATGAGVNAGLVLPPGVTLTVHDPEDRARIAYLASTSNGRRVYLDRLLTDADVVVPVGGLGFGDDLGYRGPWGGIFPGSSDTPTRAELRQATQAELPQVDAPALRESAEVSWLLGSQFHVGVEVAARGVAGIIVGQQEAVLRSGVASVEAVWSIRAPEAAGLVLAGIGVPWRPTTLEDLAVGLETAARLARSGGKIVALSRAGGTPGRALSRLAGLDDPREGLAALRGLEREADHATAQRIARALIHADVYLQSALDPDLVEALGMFPLARPEEARRLVALSDSCSVLSPAEFFRAEVVEPET